MHKMQLDYLASEQVDLAQEHSLSKKHEHLVVFKISSGAAFVQGGFPIGIGVFKLSLRTQAKLLGSKVGGLGLIVAYHTAHWK